MEGIVAQQQREDSGTGLRIEPEEMLISEGDSVKRREE